MMAGGVLVVIDPLEGQGRQVICHRAGGDSDTRTHTLQTETDGLCNGQTWSVNGGHEGVQVMVRAELTLLGCI